MALEDLILSSTYDQEQLERVISPYVRFSPTEVAVRFMRPWFKLSAEKKILMFLITERTRVLLDGKVPQRAEPLTPLSLHAELRLPGGTIRPKLKLLREQGFVEVSENGAYSFILEMLPEVEKLFTAEGEVNKDD